MGKNVFVGSIFALVAALLQSTIISRLAMFQAKPDFVLMIIVFVAYLNGTMTGQLTGFFSGLLLDFISAAPIGFNAFVCTMLGALAGRMKGTFFLGKLILPMCLCAGATLFKAGCYALLHLLFPAEIPTYTVEAPTLWVELSLNTIIAPFFFAFLRLFSSLLIGKKEN